MAKNITLDDIRIAKYIDYEGFRQELIAGNDRVKAVLGGAYLEQGLSILLSKLLIDKKNPYTEVFDEYGAPIYSFHDKIILSYYLGLISKQEFDDLKVIKDIRNKFAHGLHRITFEDQKISKLCKKLLIAKEINLLDDVKESFVMTVAILCTYIDDRITMAKDARKQTPEDFEVKEIISPT